MKDDFAEEEEVQSFGYKRFGPQSKNYKWVVRRGKEDSVSTSHPAAYVAESPSCPVDALATPHLWGDTSIFMHDYKLGSSIASIHNVQLKW
ncbi:hypothetical protein DUI87_07719 [Hirundo rustica rustica]|uniref:Uncharacterized protein n=1 Tax=Hirundo rustica rustica TaxID=333673 RepID=A0A3M0KQT3_HIRRU|nr:hypothetical protein DUI87_07719 [Hirundo rustica rustica]